VKEREKVIFELKEKKQLEEERVTAINFQTKEFKRKTLPFIAKTMVQVA
jgi:hypothetical protein